MPKKRNETFLPSFATAKDGKRSISMEPKSRKAWRKQFKLTMTKQERRALKQSTAKAMRDRGLTSW